MKFFPGLKSAKARFARDQRGVVALMFGLMILPILGAIGLAIDFGNVMAARSKAQMAADAAVLQASGVARDLIKDSSGSDADTANAIADAKKRAESLFAAHAAQAGFGSPVATITITRTGQVIEATASFTVATKTFVGRVFGRDSFTAVGKAVASSSMPTYSDVYLALDISGSMGIAASQTEMTKLYNAKGYRVGGGVLQTSCVFGCHTIESGWTESFSSVASRLGVRLRIDVLRDAVLNMVNTAQSDAESAPIYRLGLYTMGASADASTWSLNAIAPLSNNFATLKTAAQTIDIATPPPTAPQKQNSYINEQLTSLGSTVPTSYDGSSQAKSKKYVFIITDGVRDVPASFGSCTTPPSRNYGKWGTMSSSRCTNAINPAICKTFKDKGITVGVLYTTYIPIPDNANSAYDKTNNYNQWFGFEVRDNPVPGSSSTLVYGQVQPALQTCASTGWFFEASDDTSIEAAMTAMFAQTSLAPALTN